MKRYHLGVGAPAWDAPFHPPAGERGSGPSGKWSPARRAIWRRYQTRGSRSVVVPERNPACAGGADTVKKGQLLVSGTVPITEMMEAEEISSYRDLRADARYIWDPGAGREKGASALEGNADGNGKETIRNCFGSRRHTHFTGKFQNFMI
ncbi:MAG: hypothetical protein ACLT76_00050 [Clostridium fessum]